MASEIRVDKINSLSGVGTVTLSPTGVDIAGITTVATFKVGTGVTVSSDGDIFATGVTTSTTFVGALTGNVTGNATGLSGTPNISAGTIAGSTGTFTGDVDIADKIVHTGDTNTTIRFPAADTITAETGGTERLRITSDGKVSVNHTATSGMAPLSVKNTDDDNINVFEVYNDNGNNSGGFSQASDGDGTIFAKKNDGTLSVMFRADGDSYVLGDFGVGTSSPQDAGLTVENSSEARLRVRAGTNASNGEVALRADGGNTQLGTWSDHDLKLVRNTTEVASLTTNGISLPSGKGIDFSATGDASGMDNELLDDYEEGSWTPVIGGWDTATYYSGSSYYSGWYVKVGKLIHVGWKIYYQNLTTASSSNPHVRISGLPYNSYSVASGPVGHTRFDIPEFGFSGYQLTYLAANDSVLYMYKHVNGSNNLAAINATSNYSNSWTMGTATYYTA